MRIGPEPVDEEIAWERLAALAAILGLALMAIASLCGCVADRDYVGVRAGVKTTGIVGEFVGLGAEFEIRESRGAYHATADRGGDDGDGVLRGWLRGGSGEDGWAGSSRGGL